jgi:hypothetical protein
MSYSVREIVPMRGISKPLESDEVYLISRKCENVLSYKQLTLQNRRYRTDATEQTLQNKRYRTYATNHTLYTHTYVNAESVLLLSNGQ